IEGGCDCFILETFQDLNEILAALRAVRRVSATLPAIAQMTFGLDGKTLYGHTPSLVVRALKQAGADVVGVNCGVGPQPALEVPALLRLLREKFVVSVEIDPPRGINTAKVMQAAGLMAQRGVDAINIADSPLARIRMSNMALAYLIRSHFPRVEIILHFTTRDRNLMGLQSDLLVAHALGLRNILCLTGDPPSLGDYPNATAVYDTDAVGLIKIVHTMNRGTDLAGTSIGAV